MGLDSHCSKKVYGFKVKKMTSQRDIQDCRDEMTHASRGSQDTIREFPATYLLDVCQSVVGCVGRPVDFL
ncbi:hypothetical protein DPMN_137255 [Dreissena polymorpha]|uniref:Uncharacterized protein n=1 Tax=Dreissena polymorpha TaxID=45954 RepID=A0A9D4JEJ7_DREPO|nr:hypothetical protein DPMN_137255 [Dreissena polymorpha]